MESTNKISGCCKYPIVLMRDKYSNDKIEYCSQCLTKIKKSNGKKNEESKTNNTV